MSRGRGKNPSSIAKNVAQKERGSVKRRKGGDALTTEITSNKQMHHVNKFVSPDEELDLHERLTDFHFRYFKPGKPISVTFKDIGMENVGQLQRAFAEYDAIRGGGGRNSRKLMSDVSVLLGIKK